MRKLRVLLVLFCWYGCGEGAAYKRAQISSTCPKETPYKPTGEDKKKTKSTFQSERVLMSSIPKAGSHLLMAALECLIHKKGKWVNFDQLLNFNPYVEFVAMHIPATQFQDFLIHNQFKVFFIYRDPRDLAVSLAYWIQQNPLDYPAYASILSNFNAVLAKVISDLYEHYAPYLPMLWSPLCCSVAFEDLVGLKGGGSVSKQQAAMQKILQFAGRSSNTKLIGQCRRTIFGNTPTFRRGRIGSWKRAFTCEHKKLFKSSRANDLLKELGYEKNSSW